MPTIDPRNIEVLDADQAAVLRTMSGEDSLRQALAAHSFGRSLVESGIRANYPEWSDQQVQVEVIRRMHGDTVAALATRRPNA